MPTDTTIVKPAAPLFDEARLAIAGFLARYSGPTRISYTTDLRQYFAWCTQHDLAVFAARRGHIELYARTMEERGLARSRIGRRLSTVAGFYRFAVIDGTIDASPAEYVRRPKIDTESATLGLDRMELGAFIAQGMAGSVVDQALACLLVPTRVTHLRSPQHRHRRPRHRTGAPHGDGARKGLQARSDPVAASGRPSR